MIRACLLTPLVLMLSGCCAVAEWLCGPDASRWVSVSFATPDRAVSTFREAARRGDSHVAYLCFSRAFVEGLGGFEFGVIWERIDREFPLHLLGNAKVDGPQRVSPTIVEFTLTRLGHSLELRFVRQDLLELTYYDDDLELVEGGEYPRSLRPYLEVEERDDGDTRVAIEFETLLDDRLDPNRIQRAGLARQWKIDAIRIVGDDGAARTIGP